MTKARLAANENYLLGWVVGGPLLNLQLCHHHLQQPLNFLCGSFIIRSPRIRTAIQHPESEPGVSTSRERERE